MSWRLTPAALGVLWREAELGEPPYPVALPSPGATTDERAELRARLVDELAASGLWPEGRPERELEQALRVLARPEVSVDSVWLPHPAATVPCRVLAARIGDVAYLLAQDAAPDADFLIGEIHATAVGPAVVDWLPAAPAGGRPAASLPMPGTEHAEHSRHHEYADEPDDVFVRDDRDDRSGRDERTYREPVAAPRLGSGQLAVNTRGGHRPRRRSAVLHWFDVADDGRYLAFGGDGHARVQPADAGTLVQHLGALLP